MSQRRKKWSSVNNVGIYSDISGPRKFRKQKSMEEQNGDVNGEPEVNGDEEIPHIEAPIDNEAIEEGEPVLEGDPTEEIVEQEELLEEEAPEAEGEQADALEDAVETVDDAAVEEAPIEEEADEPVAEDEVQVADEEPVEEDPVEEDPVEEDPVEGDPVEEDAVEEDQVEEDPVGENQVEEAPVEEAQVEGAPVEELATVAEEAEEEEIVAEEGANDLENVPDELQTADGLAAATRGRLIEKLSDEAARTYIRGRPIVMRIPADLRETWNPEDPLEKPALEFQLEWVYGYRGQGLMPQNFFCRCAALDYN